MTNGDIFDGKPVIMMTVCDSGIGAGDELIANLECGVCGHESGWYEFETQDEMNKGLPCPICNNLIV